MSRVTLFGAQRQGEEHKGETLVFTATSREPGFGPHERGVESETYSLSFNQCQG